MFNTLLTYFKEGNTYYGLEILERDGSDFFNLLEVKKKNGELVIVSDSEISDVKTLNENIKTNVPVLLSVNTTKVITKILDANTNAPSTEALVNSAFPDLDTDNFYYQINQRQSRPIISVAKKDYVRHILERFQEFKILPVHLSLGLGILESIVPFLELETFYTGDKKLRIDNTKISEISLNTEPDETVYELNGLNIQGRFLRTFSHVVGFLGQSLGVTNLTDKNALLQSEFQNKRVFHFGLRIGLIFFVCLLLANFLVFDHYNRKAEILETAVASTGSQKNRLLQLKSDVLAKRERYETLSKTGSSRSTYYLDRLAKDLPESVLLDGITYQPLAKPVRDSKPVHIDENIILISGVSMEAAEFSNWLERLEKESFIAEVETSDYEYLDGKTSQFTLKILLHER